MSSYPRVVGVISQQGNDLSALVNRLSDEQTMPPQVMTACGIAESNLDEHAARYGTWPDVSFGAWQQTVQFAPIGDHSQTAANIAAVREALFNVETAAGIAAPQLGQYWRAYGQYEATVDAGIQETLGRYNWPGLGYQGNPNAANIDRAVAASAAYVEAAPVSGGLVYDPWTSAEFQWQDWTCSVRTATWMLRSIGIPVEAGDMQDMMVAAGLVTPAVGLLDGSGASLAAWLSAQFQVNCVAMGYIDWEWLLAEAGGGPIGLGGHNWGVEGHWAAIRLANADSTLAVMNPARVYDGVGATMTASDFHRFVPCSAIRIPVEAAVEPEPPPDGVPPGVDEDIWNWLSEARRVLDDVRFNGRQPDGTVSVNDWDRLGSVSMYLTWSLDRLSGG